MWIKLKFEATVGIATTGGSHIGARILKKSIPVCIEVEKPERAFIVSNDLSNNPKITDVKVMLNRPADESTIYIDKEGHTESGCGHLVTNNDIQSFIWAIRAGISMGEALYE